MTCFMSLQQYTRWKWGLQTLRGGLSQISLGDNLKPYLDFGGGRTRGSKKNRQWLIKLCLNLQSFIHWTVYLHCPVSLLHSIGPVKLYAMILLSMTRQITEKSFLSPFIDGTLFSSILIDNWSPDEKLTKKVLVNQYNMYKWLNMECNQLMNEAIYVWFMSRTVEFE